MKKHQILSNNFYFLVKAFHVSPIYLLLAVMLRVLWGLRTFFMYVYFLPHIISCLESGRSLRYILFFTAVSFVVVCLTYVVQSLFDEIYTPISRERIAQSLKKTIFEKARLTDYKLYDSQEYYSSFSLAVTESDNRVLSILDNVLNLLELVVTSTSMIAYSMTADIIVPIVTAVSFFISIIMNRHLSVMRVTMDKYMKELDRKSSMLYRILYIPEYAKEIRLSNLRNIVLRHYKETNSKKDIFIRNNSSKLGCLSALKTIISSALCIDFLVPLYLVWRVLFSKTLLISQFMLVLNSCSQLQMKLDSISEEIGVFYQNGEFVERYRQVESRKPSIEESNNIDRFVFAEDFETLELCNICFTYGEESFSLHKVDLTIHKGDKIAIVGPNGSGKTTLIKLMLRLYDPSEGEVRLNGKSIRSLPVTQYRSIFSTLFQDFNIYSTSIKKNVAMDEDIDVNQVKESLLRADFSKAAEQCDQRIDRELYTDGTSFSGGQLQRIALSRVLYDSRDVIVMDEPTSAMDIVFEKKFYDIVFDELKNKTIIFVSHRLSSCVLCDKIIYMEDGCIVESGSHVDLMNLRGKYQRMFKAQMDSLM